MDSNEKTSDLKEVVHGVLAEFDSPGALIEGAKYIRDAGFTKWDCHSPFPVHGIDPAMGIKPTILPVLVFGGGCAGLVAALGMQTWMNGISYPFVVAGKPLFSLPMQIPIGFELTVLLAGITCFMGMWALNKLPQVWHPLFKSDRFLRASSDGFFVSIDASDKIYQRAETERLLKEAGATYIEEVRHVTGKSARKLPNGIIGFIVLSACLALVPFALVAKARASRSAKPHYHVIPNMDFQPKAKPQQANPVFADQRAQRQPVEGTVARGETKSDGHFNRGLSGGGWATTFPESIELDEAFMERGENRYNVYCQPCHGLTGEGNGMVAKEAEGLGTLASAWVAPSNMTQEGYVKQPHGQLFNTVTYGIRSMPGYASQIKERDRWAIVFYVRALQRAANATRSDVPENRQQEIK